MHLLPNHNLPHAHMCRSPNNVLSKKNMVIEKDELYIPIPKTKSEFLWQRQSIFPRQRQSPGKRQGLYSLGQDKVYISMRKPRSDTDIDKNNIMSIVTSELHDLFSFKTIILKPRIHIHDVYLPYLAKMSSRSRLRVRREMCPI